MIFAAAEGISWRAFLRAQRGRASADAELRLDSRFDWTRVGRLGALLGFDVSKDAALEADLAEPAAGAIAAARIGDHGRALALATAALAAEPADGADPNMLFLRGALRLGAPDSSEPSAIDPTAAARDFARAVEAARAAFRLRPTAERRMALAACLFALAWARFVGGAPRTATEPAAEAATLAPSLPIARYLEAKAAAATDPERARRALAAVIRLDAGFAALAETDADLNGAKGALAAVSTPLRAAAEMAEIRLEEIRSPAAAALARLKDGPAKAAPPEFFTPLPFPGEGAPLGARLGAVRLFRAALGATLADIAAALAEAQPNIRGRIDALRQARRRDRQAARLAAFGGGFLGAAGAAVLLSMEAPASLLGLEGAEALLAQVGAAAAAGCLAAAALWRGVAGGAAGRRAAAILDEAEDLARRLAGAASAIEYAERALKLFAADPLFDDLWPVASPPTEAGAAASRPTLGFGAARDAA